jgi:DNA-directed RNA polymerase sigma subunit (sigma70/sigma32)
MKDKKRSLGRPREAMLDKPVAKRVAALKAKGWTFSEIGEKLGVSKQRAHAIHARMLSEQGGTA